MNIRFWKSDEKEIYALGTLRLERFMNVGDLSYQFVASGQVTKVRSSAVIFCSSETCNNSCCKNCQKYERGLVLKVSSVFSSLPAFLQLVFQPLISGFLWLELGSQVDSISFHFLLLPIQYREVQNTMRAELAGSIANSGCHSTQVMFALFIQQSWVWISTLTNFLVSVQMNKGKEDGT